MQVTAEKALSDIRDHMERIRNDEHATVGAMSVGDLYPQGDVGIIYVGEVVPSTWEKAKVQEPQVAPGSTQGSRHIIESLDGVTIYKQNTSSVLDGPGIEATKPWCLTHPEHGDRTFGPGVYTIQYQKDLAEEERRVMD